MKTKLFLIAFLVVVCTLLVSGPEKRTNPPALDTAFTLEKVTVTKVTDGDTLHVDADGKDIKVRIIGVDCPEITGTPEPYGEEAKNFVTQELQDKVIWLQKDEGDEDRYGRKLRYVWLKKPDSIDEENIRTKMLNALLLREGLAEVMTVKPNTQYHDLFRTIESEAIISQKGLWVH